MVVALRQFMKVKVSTIPWGFASNGLIMGTRSGDIDHSLIFIINSLGYSSEEVNSILLKKSGMLGLTGYSDLRDIEAEAEKAIENVS
jgi:acetate kinase